MAKFRTEESVGRATAFRHGQDLDGQVGNVLREGDQSGERCLAFGRVHQNKAVDQVIPAKNENNV